MKTILSIVIATLVMHSFASLQAQNIALNKTVTVSTTESPGTLGNSAVDGSLTTRWGSTFSDAQWIYVDLGTTYNITRVKVTWEAALGKDYQIQIGGTTSSWNTIKSIAGNTTLVNDHTGLAGSGRYLRINCTARGTGYGYSIFELEVYGTTTPTNVPPTANAGADKSIALPLNSVLINGAGSDSDGTISAQTWTQVSGPSIATLSGANTVNLTASNLVAGTYTFRLSVTDNGGLAGTDNVNVVVNNSGSGNIALNKIVTASSAENGGTLAQAAVDGNLSTRWSSLNTDPQWIYIDLGTSYTINRVKITWEAAMGKDYLVQIASSPTDTWTTLTTITGNTALVNDHTGLSGTGRYVRIYGTARGTQWGYSIWELEVYNGSSPNVAPTANAGADKAITLPTNSVTLNGNGSDTDGTIAGLSWSQVSGPNTANLTNANTANLTTSGLIIGTYVFRLTVTDNGGLTGNDNVTVVVSNTSSGNLALNKVITVSSIENEGTPGSAAVDGNFTTRWSSAVSDPQWIYVDFGTPTVFNRVKITWETAMAKDYQIQTAAATGGPWTTLRTTTSNNSLVNDHSGLAGNARYLRIYGTARTTGYGYSVFEMEVYNGTSAPVNVPLHIPYVQYLDLGISPADRNGIAQLITQNTNREATLSYYSGETVTIRSNDYRGNDRLEFWTLSQTNDTIKMINGAPLTTMIYQGIQLNVRLVKVQVPGGSPVADAGLDQTITLPTNCANLDGSRSSDPDGTVATYAWSQVSGPNTATLTGTNTAVLRACTLIKGSYVFRLLVSDNTGLTSTDDVTLAVQDAPVFDFSLLTPANGAMITNSRKPTFTWNAVSGATRYDIYVNITRSDYDWYASGNFLERYTKVGESATPNFTITTDLVDRWTYRWYVIAATSSGNKTSNKLQFSVYIPTMESEPDGINIVNGVRDCNKNGTIEPYEDWRLPIDTRTNDLMARLTLDEKYRQCFYSDQDSRDGFSFSYGVEGGMRTLQYNASATRLGIPIAFAGDKIHGWKTIFPTQLGLAATRDMNLVYRCGNLQRIEHKSFGFTGTLAPLAEVDTKVLYPRFQEGAGENADEAAAMARALVVGMQGGPEINPHSMLITIKHWPGQGAGGESVLQYDATTIKYHMKPWQAIVEANAASVMPGYNSAPFLDPTGKGANSSKPIINYLRNEMQFKGFVVTDWLAANTAQSIESMGAGIDVMGGAPSANTNVNELVSGITLARVDESVRKILDLKFRLGMFENPYSDPTTTWTNAAHHAIALEAAKKSITLLKNDGVLPLKVNSGENMIVAGPRATWVNSDVDPNVIWQSIYYSNPQAKNYLKAFQDRGVAKGVNVFLNDNATGKVAIVVIGEQNYTHGTEWADKNPNIPVDQVAVIQNFRNRGIPVVTVILTPRPYVITNILSISNAVMFVYRGGNGIAQATAELCFGDFNPSGKLPFQLPRSTDQLGTDNTNDQKEKWELPYDLGATDAERTQIRSFIANNQPVPSTFGNPLLPYGYGLQNFNVSIPATRSATDHTSIEKNSEEDETALSLFPNPTSGVVALQYQLKQREHVKLSVFNGLGTEQRILVDKIQEEGSHQFSFDSRYLPKGVYVIRLKVSGRVTTSKLLKQ
jgi:beta-glucosidase-like glycosyl hydrolase